MKMHLWSCRCQPTLVFEIQKRTYQTWTKPSQLDQGLFIWSINDKPVGTWYALSTVCYGEVTETLLTLLAN